MDGGFGNNHVIRVGSSNSQNSLSREQDYGVYYEPYEEEDLNYGQYYENQAELKKIYPTEVSHEKCDFGSLNLFFG